MSKGAAFFKKYAWVTFAFLAIGILFCNALGMLKIGVVFMAIAVVSLMITLLIPAVKYEELHIRGCIYRRKETPITFNIIFFILSALGIAGVAMLVSIFFTWDN